jgi:hypothetical protein
MRWPHHRAPHEHPYITGLLFKRCGEAAENASHIQQKLITKHKILAKSQQEPTTQNKKQNMPSFFDDIH